MSEPSALSPNGHRAVRDGCGCPPWVIRCAHWDGQILVLGETALHHPIRCNLEPSGHFGVFIGERFQPHDCGRSGHMLLPPTSSWGTGFPFRSLPAAEGEFHRREMALLGREA
jgi:hypothetical protein